MQRLFIPLFIFIFCTVSFAQTDFQRLVDSEKALNIVAANKGAKAAFLEYMASDAVVFRPKAVNGVAFWGRQPDTSGGVLTRKIDIADISANGLLGYATGSWELHPNGKSDAATRFGQYVTIWEKKAGKGFRAVLEINIMHDEITNTAARHVVAADDKRDSNKRGWSVADASMNFQRVAMSKDALAGAYDRFMGHDARILLDGLPPLNGRKTILSETRRYRSVLFPNQVNSFQTADMAYMWNPCSYATSEGIEAGNCLQIWKLRNKKWWIVLGVFAAVADETQPILRLKNKSRKKN
jgi:ketosteroid isomerase-like protein